MKTPTTCPTLEPQSFSRSPNLRAWRLCLGACLLLAEAAWLQASPEPIWEWVTRAGGPNHDAGYRVAVDGEGNTCILGTFWSTITVGTNVLHCTENTCGFFVAKQDPAGQVLWAQAADMPTGSAYGFRLAVDGAGNVHVTGLFHGQVRLGSSTLQGEPGRDCVLLVKFDPDGRLLWARHADGVSEDSNHHSAVDAAGNVYLAGAFLGDAQIGPYQLFSRGSYDVFVAKYDAAGVVQWVRQAGGADFDASQGLYADAAGNVYVTGHFSGTAQFDETNEASSVGSQDVFLAKYESAGRLLWVMTGGGAGSDYGDRVAVNAAGEVYLTGQFRDPAMFGSVSVTGSGWNNAFLLKCDPAGQVLWATTAGDASNGGCQDLRLDPTGHPVLLGWFEGWADFGTNSLVAFGGYDAFVAKYNPAGEVLWAVAAGDTGNEVSTRLGLDAEGHVYLTAGFGGMAMVGTNELSSLRQAVFVAKLDPAGQVLWATQVAGCAEGYVYVDDAAVDPAGGVYVHGHFQHDAAFGPDCYTNQSTDIFVAKLAGGPSQPRIVTQPQSATRHVGTTARFNVMAGGAWPRSFAWFKDGEALVENPGRITGTTASILQVRRLETADAGDFMVTVRNPFGVVTSAVAVLTVDPAPLPPVFVAQPQDLVVGRGDAATFLVVVTGSEPFSFQWQHNGVDLPDATNAMLTLTAVLTNQAGVYTVRVSNGAGLGISDGARLTVLPITTLTEALDDYGLVWRSDPEHPWLGQTLVSHDGVDAAQSGYIDYEQSTWIETTVTGPGVISFRWKIGSPHEDDLVLEIDRDAIAGIEGATDWHRRSFSVPAGPHALHWRFTTEEVGSAGPRFAWLDEVSFTTNEPAPPTIAVPPRHQRVAEGDDVLFTVTAEGTEPFACEWQRDGLACAWSDRLILMDVTPACAGTYTAIVTNIAGAATAAAKLEVGPPVVTWDWARTAASTDGATVTGLAVDDAGQVYVTGQFDNVASFGTNQLVSQGSSDIFLAKYDRTGRVLWAQRAGGPDTDIAVNLARDGAGNVLVNGLFRGTADFGGLSLVADHNEDVFLAKFDGDGTVRWARAVGGGTLNGLGRMVVDRAGNIYFSGEFYEALFGDIHLTATSYYDAFLVKCSAAGNVLWARQAGGPDWNTAHDLAVDSVGRVYLSGTFVGSVTVGTATLTGNRSYLDAFLAQFDADGNLLGARVADTNHLSAYALAVDATDNLYVQGCFYGTTLLGTNRLTATGSRDFFLAKYDSAGQGLWARKIASLGSGDSEHGFWIATDRAGNLYVKGEFRGGLQLDDKCLFSLDDSWPGAAFLAQYDGAGQPLWARRLGGYNSSSGSDWRPSDFAVDAAGGVYVTGTFNEAISFGTNTLAPVGPRDVYLAKLGSTLRCAVVRADVVHGGCRVTLTGLAERSPVIIQASTNLVTWESISTNTVPSQTFEFSEPLCPAQPARFYRAVVP